jgi:hypothetical protein
MSASTSPATKPPLPPVTLETAHQKVKAAQDVWNTRDPQIVKNAYTSDSIWRNRDNFFQGTDAIVEFLSKKWKKENGYRLRKELFAFTQNKVSLDAPRVTRLEGKVEILMDNRLQYNSGMNGMTQKASGGVLMDLRTGLLQRMGG